jgi:hypothetical protein
VSSIVARNCLNFLLPSRRPMDNMATGWDRPQEDEFALCNLGAPSPYLQIAFPNEAPKYDAYLTLDEVGEEDRARWGATLKGFLRTVYLRAAKRIILKSPPHTGRVEHLGRLFPGAKFVHIVRDPVTVYCSTLNLWRQLYEKHGMQIPKFAGLEERVLSTMERMYEAFERQRATLGPGRMIEVRYEALTADPRGVLRRVYEELDLGDFAAALPGIEAYLESTRDYQTNRYPKTAVETRRTLAERWGRFFARHGYAIDTEAEEATGPAGVTRP